MVVCRERICYDAIIGRERCEKPLPYSIGIITAENSYRLIRDIEGSISPEWDLTYLSYTSLNQLKTMYAQKHHRFDGFVFSGRFNYECILSQNGMVSKPHVVFELADRDYYKAFARMLFLYPGTDIGRVLMEEPIADIDFSDIFGGHSPTYFDINLFQHTSLESTYDTIMAQAMELWRANKIDRVITRFTNMARPLQEAGLPVEVLFPSRPTMLECFRQLQNEIQGQMLKDTLTVFGIVCCSSDVSEADLDGLENVLHEFNGHTGMSLVIRRIEGGFELATSNQVLMDITQNYTNCQLTHFLHSRLPQEGICVGWGVDSDIAGAYQNSAVALRESQRNLEHHAFLVGMQKEQIGPLVSGRSITVEHIPGAEAEQLGHKLGISPRNLQKLLNISKKRGASYFSSSDLAYYLSITPRSANRILAKLEKVSCAQMMHNTQPISRGRPSKVYKVDFDALERMWKREFAEK